MLNVKIMKVYSISETHKYECYISFYLPSMPDMYSLVYGLDSDKKILGETLGPFWGDGVIGYRKRTIHLICNNLEELEKKADKFIAKFLSEIKEIYQENSKTIDIYAPKTKDKVSPKLKTITTYVYDGNNDPTPYSCKLEVSLPVKFTGTLDELFSKFPQLKIIKY